MLKFHDLRSMALSNWFAAGMKEYDVMNLAGQSSFDTTQQSYLAGKGTGCGMFFDELTSCGN